MKLRIENLGGLASVDCQLPESGLVVVTGANGAGKSTLLRAVGGLLTSRANPAGLSPAQQAKWLGREGAIPAMELSGEDWEVRQTGNKLASEGVVPAAHPFAVGMEDILDLPQRQSVELLETILVPEQLVRRELPRALAQALIGGQPTSEETDDILRTDARLRELVDEVVEQLGSEPNWKGLAAVYVDRRKTAQRNWKIAFGDGEEFGATKSATKRPNGWRNELEEVSPADAGLRLKNCEEAMAGLHQKQADLRSAELAVEGAEAVLERQRAKLNGALQPTETGEWTLLDDQEIEKWAEKEKAARARYSELEKMEDYAPALQERYRQEQDNKLAVADDKLARLARQTNLRELGQARGRLAQLKNSVDAADQPQDALSCPVCDAQIALNEAGELEHFVDAAADTKKEVKVEAEQVARLEKLTSTPLGDIPVELDETPGLKQKIDDALEFKREREKEMASTSVASVDALNMQIELKAKKDKALNAGELQKSEIQRLKGRVEQAEAQLKQAQQDAAGHRQAVPSAVQLAEAEERVVAAREDEAMIIKHRQCQLHYSEWKTANAIADVLGTSGWRRQRISEALKVVRQMMLGCCDTAQMEPVELSQSLELTYGGRPFAILSGSEKFRARLVFRLGLARAIGSSVVCADAADILDKESLENLMAAVATSAEKRGYLVLLAATGEALGEDHLHIEEGVCCPLTGDRSNAL